MQAYEHACSHFVGSKPVFIHPQMQTAQGSNAQSRTPPSTVFTVKTVKKKTKKEIILREVIETIL